MNQSDKKVKLIISVIIVVVAVAAWTAYAYRGNENNVSDISDVGSDLTPQSNTADIDARTSDQRVTINVTDDGFSPSEIAVTRGTIVTVTNNSNRTVQFSSDEHPTHKKNTEMNLNPLEPGSTASYTAREVGSWGFHDHLNDSWTGILTVNN